MCVINNAQCSLDVCAVCMCFQCGYIGLGFLCGYSVLAFVDEVDINLFGHLFKKMIAVIYLLMIFCLLYVVIFLFLKYNVGTRSVTKK